MYTKELRNGGLAKDANGIIMPTSAALATFSAGLI
jgi:hypothetical protein